MSKRKQRSYSAEFKFQTVMEALRGQKTKGQICRERQITNSMLYKWEQQFLKEAPEVFKKQGRDNEELEAKETQIAELERMVGRLTMENEVLKKSTGWLSQRSRSNGR